MASLKMKKGFLLGFANFLNELELSGSKSRERTRFVKTLSEEVQKLEEEKKLILEKYVLKGENKEWLKTVDNGQEVWDIPAEKKGELNTEVIELFEEEAVFDILESNKARMATIKDIVMNTDFRFGPRENDSEKEKMARIRQAAEYNLWCEAFEACEI